MEHVKNHCVSLNSSGSPQNNPDEIEKLFNHTAARALTNKHIPGSTYRVQFNKFFTFNDAASQAAYLRELGITDLYASPFFKASPDSLHGYDVCDYNQLNPAIGSE